MITTKENISKLDKLSQLVEAFNELSDEDFTKYIDWFLSRRHDQKLATKELHDKLTRLHYVVSTFYTFFNDEFYYPSLVDFKIEDDQYITVEELAKKFNVHIKTISNWEKSGLKILRPSPRVLVVSKVHLYSFFESNSGLK